MAQKRIVVVMAQNSTLDQGQVSQVLDETAQSLQQLAKTLAGNRSEAKPMESTAKSQEGNEEASIVKRRGRAKKANAPPIDKEAPPKKRGRKPKKDATPPAADVLDEIPSTSLEKRASPIKKQEDIEDSCPVCLETPLHPVTLPSCRHVYCFLCGKGLVESGAGQCALCRSHIPPDFFKHPSTSAKSEVAKGDFFWYYEGRNGWWRYEFISFLKQKYFKIETIETSFPL